MSPSISRGEPGRRWTSQEELPHEDITGLVTEIETDEQAAEGGSRDETGGAQLDGFSVVSFEGCGRACDTMGGGGKARIA